MDCRWPVRRRARLGRCARRAAARARTRLRSRRVFRGERRRRALAVLQDRRSAPALRGRERRDRLLASVQIGRDDCNHIRVEMVDASATSSRWRFTPRQVRSRERFTDLVGAGLVRFRDGLRVLYERLAGTATLTGDYERTLQIEVTGDGRGHLTAACDVTDDPAFGARLQFTIALIRPSSRRSSVGSIRFSRRSAGFWHRRR